MQNIFWIENDWVAPWDFARPREEQTQTIVLIEQGEKGVIPPLQTSTLLSVQVGDIFWLFICNSRRLMICPAKKNNKRKTKLFGAFYFWGVSFYLILGSAAASHVRNLFHLIRHEIFFFSICSIFDSSVIIRFSFQNHLWNIFSYFVWISRSHFFFHSLENNFLLSIVQLFSRLRKGESDLCIGPLCK